MSIKIICENIKDVSVDAIVNPVSVYPIKSERDLTGAVSRNICLSSINQIIQAGDNIEPIKEGQVAVTLGYGLAADFIMHAVFPQNLDQMDVDLAKQKVWSFYKNCILTAKDNDYESIAFPYLLNESSDEILFEALTSCFSSPIMDLNWEARGIDVYLVFDGEGQDYKRFISLVLNRYIDLNYLPDEDEAFFEDCDNCECDFYYEDALSERMEHVEDTFSEYLLYLIKSKGMTNAEVYKKAIVDKKVFSKLKNNPDYHPQKITALCLCIGAELTIDESRELLSRAGYALSPCDKTDIIFSFFIENGIYDMIELDIQLEEHGLDALIS